MTVEVVGHRELFENSFCLIYIRDFGRVKTLWYEDKNGKARGCVNLIWYSDDIWEMQITLQSLLMPDFKLFKDKAEDYLREINPEVKMIFGYSNADMITWLKLSDGRVSMKEDFVQVGSNQKFRIEWDLTQRRK